MRLLDHTEVQTANGTRSAAGVEACGFWAQSGEGAACFDHWPLPAGRLALFLGDASDHGPAGPRVLAGLRAELRALTRERADPEELLALLNAHLHERLPSRRFVTAFVGCLGSDGQLRWCSAGQGPVYVSRRAREDFDALPAQAPPLGVDADLRLQATTLQLGAGGRVVVLSDGVLDADNGAGRLLGARRLKTVLDNTAGLSLDTVVGLVRDVLFTWQGGSTLAGDQALLAAGLAE